MNNDGYDTEPEFEIVGMELSRYEREIQKAETEFRDTLKMNNFIFIYVLLMLICYITSSIEIFKTSFIPLTVTVIVTSMANNIAIVNLFQPTSRSILLPYVAVLIGLAFATTSTLGYLAVAVVTFFYATLVYVIYKRMMIGCKPVDLFVFAFCVFGLSADPLGVSLIALFFIAVLKKRCPLIRSTEKPNFTFVDKD